MSATDKLLHELVAAHEMIQEQQNEVDINLAISKFKGVATKRNVTFIMSGLHILEDIRKLFSDDLDVEDLITDENKKYYEKAIEKFCNLHKSLKDHLSHEKNMRVIAAT